jgi:hypothetical protein
MREPAGTSSQSCSGLANEYECTYVRALTPLAGTRVADRPAGREASGGWVISGRKAGARDGFFTHKFFFLSRERKKSTAIDWLARDRQ